MADGRRGLGSGPRPRAVPSLWSTADKEQTERRLVAASMPPGVPEARHPGLTQGPLLWRQLQRFAGPSGLSRAGQRAPCSGLRLPPHKSRSHSGAGVVPGSSPRLSRHTLWGQSCRGGAEKKTRRGRRFLWAGLLGAWEDSLRITTRPAPSHVRVVALEAKEPSLQHR